AALPAALSGTDRHSRLHNTGVEQERIGERALSGVNCAKRHSRESKTSSGTNPQPLCFPRCRGRLGRETAMAQVHFVCVHQDHQSAETLADLFERAGFSVAGAPHDQDELRTCIASVLIVSRAALRSMPFLDVAKRVVAADKALIASFLPLPKDLDLV